MDIDEEFDSLCLPSDKRSLAWEARAKIIWGGSGDEVQNWLTEKGIDYLVAKQIVAIAVGERAMAIRGHGVKDLVIGVVVGVSGSGIGIGTGILMKLGLLDMQVGAFAVHKVYGLFRTVRGLERIVFGARIDGAVSDLDS